MSKNTHESWEDLLHFLRCFPVFIWYDFSEIYFLFNFRLHQLFVSLNLAEV